MITKQRRKECVNNCLTIVVALAGTAIFVGPCLAQNFPNQEQIMQQPMQPPQMQPPIQQPVGSSQVTMMLLKIEKSHGQKFLITQAGDKVPISGDQLAKDATSVAIYRDANSNYWFINKYGNPTSIPPEKVQWAINVVKSERAQEAQALQPGTNTTTSGTGAVQQTTIIQSPSNNSGSGALMTAAAAMGGGVLGGMIGGAIDDPYHYYGVPYGTAMYHDAAGMYHYNGNGNRVYVNNEHTNQISNQFNNVGDWDHRNEWQNNMHNFDQAHSFSGAHEGWGGFHHFGGGEFHGFRR